MKRFNWLLTGLVLLSLTTILLAGCVSKSDYEALQADYDTLQQQSSSLSTQLQQVQQAQADLAELRAELQADYDTLQPQTSSLSTQLQQVQQAQADLAELRAELQADYDALQQQSSSLSTQLGQAQSDLAERQADYDKSEMQNRRLNLQLQQVQADLAELLAVPLTIDQVADVVRSYLLDNYGGGLVLTEVMEWNQQFYVGTVEEDTGIGALELLVDKYTGEVTTCMVTNHWNEKYGMHSTGQSGLDMPVSSEQAESIAQEFLDTNMPWATAAHAHIFHGYYTIMFTFEGEHYGMLSVNGYSGEVWYHAWHGPFIGEEDDDHL